MDAGYIGTFVISCSQTEIGGQKSARPEKIEQGVTWRWQGEPLRVDGANSFLSLGMPEGEGELRKRAARMVRRMFHDRMEAGDGPDVASGEEETLWQDRSFTVTDGYQTFHLALLEPGAGRIPLLMSVGPLPPKDQDLWVVEGLQIEKQVHDVDDVGAGVICFTPGTLIRTARGDVAIETLKPGDLVQSKDSGEQEIRWVGQRRLSGARLFTMPGLRPIRVRKGALIGGGPERDLWLSPDHRILIGGAGAEVLFNTDEVLVAARDLVNGVSIHADHTGRDVSYLHLMFDSHEVIWANGVETESFHPAMARLDLMDTEQRSDLFAVYPELETDPGRYGDSARRMLAEPEAALLCHELAMGH